MKKELLLILILFISMGYSVNAQRSLTNEYPYTEVLNCLSNPDTIFVCRIHNTAKNNMTFTNWLCLYTSKMEIGSLQH